jgi:Fur family transcriptional regulator, iron response regulator
VKQETRTVEARPVQGSPEHTLELAGCPVNAVKKRLRDKGLRPTRQRILLGWMLFGRGHRHVTAEALHEEARKADRGLSLATVYNTLHQFTESGLLRRIPASSGKSCFDTNPTDHHHFVIDGEDVMFDIETSDLVVTGLPTPPPGFVIDGVELLVRLKRVGKP